MRSLKFLAALALASPVLAQPPASQYTVSESAYTVSDSRLTYADLADLALAAPVVVQVEVGRTVRLKPVDAPGLAPGHSRFYVSAEVVSLIRGERGIPLEIGYIVDLPNTAAGRPPKIAKKSQFILLAARVPDRPAELRLIAPDAQLAYSADTADRLRAILREASAADAAPKITGIGRAFYVPGTLPGESETQIFLQAADGRPVSLSVLRRPGEQPRWSVALSEIVDDAAAPPERDTLLWYRLACTLPPQLPPQSLSEAEPDQQSAIIADYRLIKERLGPCARSRTS